VDAPSPAFDPREALTPLFTPGLRLFAAHLATVVGRALRLSAMHPTRVPALAAQLHLVVSAALRAALAQAAAVTLTIVALERPGEALDADFVDSAAAGLAGGSVHIQQHRGGGQLLGQAGLAQALGPSITTAPAAAR
jgi:hypothetical protein